jgi:hypothetical protein
MATTTYLTNKHIDRLRTRHDTRVTQISTLKDSSRQHDPIYPNPPMIVQAISGIVCKKLTALFSPRSSGFQHEVQTMALGLDLHAVFLLLFRFIARAREMIPPLFAHFPFFSPLLLLHSLGFGCKSDFSFFFFCAGHTCMCFWLA